MQQSLQIQGRSWSVQQIQQIGQWIPDEVDVVEGVIHTRPGIRAAVVVPKLQGSLDEQIVPQIEGQ